MNPSLIRVCDAAQLADGGDGVRFTVPGAGGPAAAFAIRHGGRVHAYLNRCAHVGVELDWVEGRFLDGDGRWLICSAHGALYEPSSGACAGGPCAGRGGLRELQLIEIGGVVYRRPEPWEAGGAGSAPA